jgi:hypothetical protein
MDVSISSIPPFITSISALATFILGYTQVARLFRFNKRRVQLELISFLEKINYDSESSVQSFINSQVFQNYFDLPTPPPVHHVNLLLNSFDPSRASFIYSKFPRLMNFSKNAITKPKNFDGDIRTIKFLSYGAILLLAVIFLLLYLTTNMISDHVLRWIMVGVFLVGTIVIFNQFNRMVALLNDIGFVEAFYKDADAFRAAIKE